MRKYYSPGMISLFVIPLFTLIFTSSYVKEHDFRFLRLNLPEIDTPENNDNMHFTISSIYRNKEIVDVGEVPKDTNSINGIFEKLANINLDTALFKNKNFDYGYKFRLRKNLNYGELVFLLNKCAILGFKKYVLDIQNDNFVVLQKKYDFSNERRGLIGDNFVRWHCQVVTLEPIFEFSQRYFNYKYYEIKEHFIEKRNELLELSKFYNIYLTYFCFVLSVIYLKFIKS